MRTKCSVCGDVAVCVWLCFDPPLMSAQTNAKHEASFDASPCTAHRLAHGDLPYVHMMGKSSDQITATSRRTHAHNMTHTHTHCTRRPPGHSAPVASPASLLHGKAQLANAEATPRYLLDHDLRGGLWLVGRQLVEVVDGHRNHREDHQSGNQVEGHPKAR